MSSADIILLMIVTNGKEMTEHTGVRVLELVVSSIRVSCVINTQNKSRES